MSTHGTLLTLYCLVIGTLLTGAAMTLWESHGRPRHGRALRSWAIGYGLLATGCAVVVLRLAAYAPRLSPPLLDMTANLLIVAGYLAIQLGIARLDGRDRRGFCSAVFGASAAVWLFWGLHHVVSMWTFACGAQIALVCAATAYDMARNRDLGGTRSIPVVVTILSIHAVIYLGRATALPLLASHLTRHGMELLAEATMYEGVVFSVALPTALLLLLREEWQGLLNTALRTDYLTGLGNRQMFNEALPGVVSAAGTWRRVALILFDLDHFKQVNDKHGHAAGDMVLRCFAGVGRSVFGPDAVFVRLGGEEFAVLLPVADITEAALIAEAVLRRFATIPTIMSGTAISATASAGVTLVHPDCRMPAEPLRVADDALYEAKKGGRNRVVVAQARSPAALAQGSAEPDCAMAEPLGDDARPLHPAIR